MAAMNISIITLLTHISKKYYIYCSETNFACNINAIPMQPTKINNIVQRIIFLQAIIGISSHKYPQRQFEAVTVTKIIKISHLF